MQIFIVLDHQVVSTHQDLGPVVSGLTCPSRERYLRCGNRSGGFVFARIDD
jgi:hypothetical protein